MRNIISMVTNVAEEKNCAVVLIGHLNKNERWRAIHRGLGSVDIAAAVRSILLVEADKKDWNCQEMCSRRIPKIMDRQESGGVMRELL